MNAQLYVGTYHKYNGGSIDGKWMDLSDYADSEEFYAACAKLHSDEADPEFMFQDFEGFPHDLYSESGNIDAIYEYIDFVEESCLDQDVIDAGLNLEIPLSEIEDKYEGSYSSDEDFAYEYAEQQGAINKINESGWPYDCIDWERAARDLMYDFTEDSGHYFSNY